MSKYCNRSRLQYVSIPQAPWPRLHPSVAVFSILQPNVRFFATFCCNIFQYCNQIWDKIWNILKFGCSIGKYCNKLQKGEHLVAILKNTATEGVQPMVTDLTVMKYKAFNENQCQIILLKIVSTTNGRLIPSVLSRVVREKSFRKDFWKNTQLGFKFIRNSSLNLIGWHDSNLKLILSTLRII